MKILKKYYILYETNLINCKSQSLLNLLDHIINDKWIMDRISSQSSSFSNWMTGLFKTVEKAIDGIDTSLMGLSELKDTEDEIA